jgi:hypothetical protein
MIPDMAPEGHKWRTLFFTWKLERDVPGEVSFPFSAAFSCGGSMKITHGQKLSLQTQFKLGEQLGGKFGIPGSEVSAGVSSEISETLAYELTASYEWSYASRPCEYCTPRIHFPQARVRILSRSTLHIPLFSIKKTVFMPGEQYEIRGHCRHAPDKCANCNNTEAPPGGGSILTVTETQGPAHLERIALAERTPTQDDIEKTLKEILSVPDDKTVPEQFFLVDLSGRIQSVCRSGRRYSLYSLDDIDRTIGAVRLYPGNNRLLLLTNAFETRAVQLPSMKINLFRKGDEELLASGRAKRQAKQSDFRLIEVEIPCFKEKKMKDKQGDWGYLRIHDEELTDELPAVVLEKELIDNVQRPKASRQLAQAHRR